MKHFPITHDSCSLIFVNDKVQTLDNLLNFKEPAVLDNKIKK